MKEWIIDYDSLEFHNVIASGSTCTVYKGKYKNNLVAIKKIKGVMDQEKMKFIKEFKREVSLLISTPH